MLISEISLKNFKSFGNSTQKLNLNTEKGELVLIVGSNGNGKSSLMSSFDYALYGKCKGSKKKWTTLSTLPNRINSNDMMVGIKFKSQEVDVEVKRGISPNILELFENGVLNEKAGKSNIDTKIEEYIGMDIETFKSFISLSINDFKNFISLSNEEKQILLDKLFNLEVINILKEILKEVNKDNKSKITQLDSEISTLGESIDSIKRSIEKAIEKEKEDIQQEIDTIKNNMESKKSEYIELKTKIDKIKSKSTEISNELENEKKQYIIIQTDIKSIDKDINLYNSGKCPTCETNFDSDHFKSLKSILAEKKESVEGIKIEIEKNIKLILERQKKLNLMYDESNKLYNDITYYLKNCKSQIDSLLNKKNKETNDSSTNISEFNNTIKELSDKKELSSVSLSNHKDKEFYYKELNKIFGEEGVKKSIIAGIIKPINHFINENIKKMGMNFEVSLNDTFSADIKHLGQTIDYESLSTGETRRINVAILISYLMLIRTKKYINILFLDEVFSSIDVQGVNDILILLKDFASNYKINIFVVHHALISDEIFDRVIMINKDVFSSIEEVKLLEEYE